jgi:endonuclease YncB( thermonuclease family)
MKGKAVRYLTFPAIVILTGMLAAPTKVTEKISGKVVGVTDGDTISLLVNEETIKVRLEGIDAPELDQSYGTKSKQELSKMVFGKAVILMKTGTDKYGRTLGIVMVGNVDANATMVEDGWAWHLKKYNDEERLAKLEVAAREAKRGLWADEKPMAPWDHRARQKTPRAKEADPKALYWLNTSSGVRHNDRCEHFQRTKKGRLCGPNDGKACGICGG